MSNQQIVKNNLDYTLFSWVKQGNLNPINASHAKGSYVYDRDGKRYLDFASQQMNVNIGHGDQRITDAVTRQMKEVSFVYPGMATDVRGKLGKKIAEITPGNLSKSFFTLGGAEAIENAIKLVRIYTGRHKIITHYRAYHGATYGAISASGDPRRFPVDNQAMPNIVHVENPYAYRCPWNSTSIEECGTSALAHLERVIQFENPDNIAAILFEGESGTSGCIKYPPMYLKRVRELCNKYDILMIVDEIMSGFGRTGKMFGVNHHDVVPDIMCLAKGLTSGYLPLGATVVTDTIAEYFNDRPMVIGLTYSGHPTLCAAALENIRIIQDDGLVDKAAKTGAYIDAEVEKLKAKHPSLGDFRNTGLLGCIELVKNKDTKEPMTPWNAKPKDMDVTNKIVAKIRELGMFTFVRWSWIFVTPPLIISKDEVDEGLDIISQAISVADKYCN